MKKPILTLASLMAIATTVLSVLLVSAALRGHSSAAVPRLHVTVAQALAAKAEMMKHGTLEPDAGDTLAQDGGSPSKPTDGTKAGEPTINSLFAQETAERSFQGQSASPAMVQNGVDQYNFLSNSTLPGKWTSLGPDYNPNSNNPDPVTQNQLAISGRVSALAVVPSTCSSTNAGGITQRERRAAIG